jgi:hypothetical protein
MREERNTERGVVQMPSTKKILTADQSKEAKTLVKGCESTAARVRTLSAAGWEKADIARALKIRYQWVRNVLNTPLKKQG